MIMTWTNAVATDVAKKWHETRYISNKEELMAFGDGLLWMCVRERKELRMPTLLLPESPDRWSCHLLGKE